MDAPVVLADVTSPDSFSSVLGDAGIRVVSTAAELQAISVSNGPVIFVDGSLMVASTDSRQILRTLAYRAEPGSNGFASTALYRRLEQAYTEGVGWLLAADLERLIGANAGAPLEGAGIADMQQFVLEQKTGAGGASYRATLGFRQNRRGMAAWLAQPSPMGALEFVSPNAYGAAGIVTKDPTSMFDDVFTLMAGKGAALQDLQNYQTEHNVDIRRDFVATLGNEFLAAVDGPILPTPSWRIVIEVNDAARLQNTIEWAVADLNRQAAARQRPGIRLTSETASGRMFYSVTGVNAPTEIHYTYWAGYMIIGPSRALLMEAIQTHDSGTSLPHSQAFRSKLPDDGRDYASGFIYQNFPDTNLICLYGEEDRIVLSSKGVLGMNVAGIAGITGMLNTMGVNGIK